MGGGIKTVGETMGGGVMAVGDGIHTANGNHGVT